jgi:hypothetical protein
LFEKQGGSENQQRADEEFFHGGEILNLQLAAKAVLFKEDAGEPDAKRARKTDRGFCVTPDDNSCHPG